MDGFFDWDVNPVAGTVGIVHTTSEDVSIEFGFTLPAVAPIEAMADLESETARMGEGILD